MTGAVLYRFRAELCSRWRAWVGLAVLVGLLSGTVILLAAGSRRTSTAYDRFRTAQNAYDVGVFVECQPLPENAGQFAVLDNAMKDRSCLDEVTALPAVAEATTVNDYMGNVETQDGVSLNPDRDPCYEGSGQAHLVADPTGRFGTSFNESRIVAGRRADPAAANEVVISKSIADRRRLAPGDTLRVNLFDGASCDTESYAWRDEQSVRIVGVGVAPGEVKTPSGVYIATVHLTPAFARNAGVVDTTLPVVLVRLHDDTTAGALEREARQAGYAVHAAISASEGAEVLRDATRPAAYSLVLIAGLVALAGLAVLGQIVLRHAHLESRDHATLAALGVAPSHQFMLAMLRGAFVGVVGAGVAVVAAVAASPLMPVGVARRVEPSAGVSVDLMVIALGFVGTLIFVLVVSAVSARRIAGRATAARGVGGRRSRVAVAAVLVKRGLGPAPASGVRLALDGGPESSAIPLRSSLVGLAVAATTLIGAVTFGAGLTHLLETPRLSGWNWDVLAGFPDPEENARPAEEARRIDHMTTELRSVGAVDEFTAGVFWPPFPEARLLELGSARVQVDLLVFDSGGAVGPSVISGRAPRAPNEILLGPGTLDALGLEIGDSVTAIGQAGEWDAPGEETSARMRIVGTGAIPNSPELGQGATMTLEGVVRLNELAMAGGVFIRRAAGVDDAELRAALGPVFGSTPDLLGPDFVDPARQLLDLREVDDAPALLGLLMAVMAAAVLAHLLVTSIGQHHRDLALLRTLGLTRRQVFETVGWQASTYLLITLVISVPLGIALGRTVWRLYAEGLGVVPEPVTPWATVAAISLAAFVIANLIAALLARRATRLAPAAILRTE